jgi:hypothetical protein
MRDIMTFGISWLLSCALLLIGCTISKDGVAQNKSTGQVHSGLLPTIEAALKQKNPAIDSVAVLSLRSLYPGGDVAVVGWGTKSGAAPPRDSRTGWDNELFGIFIFDSRLASVKKTLDTFPTRSWRDYDVHIDRFDRDSLVVIGGGITYGISDLRRAYKW